MASAAAGLAVAGAPEPQPEVLFQCCSCRQMVPQSEIRQEQSKDDIAGTKDQHRCACCKNLGQRVKRMYRDNEMLKHGYLSMTGEERISFMKKAPELLGDKLKKVLIEAVQWSTTKRQSINFTAQGDMKEIGKFMEEYADKPERRDMILANSHRHACAVTGDELIWVPSYSMSFTMDTVTMEERKRKVEGEIKIQNAKKQKPAIGDGDKENVPVGIGKQEKQQAKEASRLAKEEAKLQKDAAKQEAKLAPKPLTEKQIERLQSVVPKTEQLVHALTAIIAETSTEDMQKYVSEACLTKANKVLADAETIHKKLLAANGDRMTRGTEFADMFKQLKPIFEDGKIMQSKLKEILEEAAEEQV